MRKKRKGNLEAAADELVSAFSDLKESREYLLNVIGYYMDLHDGTCEGAYPPYTAHHKYYDITHTRGQDPYIVMTGVAGEGPLVTEIADKYRPCTIKGYAPFLGAQSFVTGFMEGNPSLQHKYRLESIIPILLRELTCKEWVKVGRKSFNVFRTCYNKAQFLVEDEWGSIDVSDKQLDKIITKLFNHYMDSIKSPNKFDTERL